MNTSDTYRLARVAAGLSLTQAAELLKVTRGRLHEIESQREQPTDQECAAMAEVYDVSTEFLKTGIPDLLGDHLAKWHDAPEWVKVNILHEFKRKILDR